MRGADALVRDYMLGFATGPLTGGWADSTRGGTGGPTLKMAGYDGVFFSGASERPVALVVDAGRARLIDASKLWGKDTYETDDMLQAELGDPGSWVISCIGPAGEACSRLAGIVNEKGRIAARAHVGGVRGSKTLNGISRRPQQGTRTPLA